MDEFHAITTSAFVRLLPEARKFGAGVVLAHQYLARIDAPLQAAVLGTVGTTMVQMRPHRRPAIPEIELLDLRG